MNREQVISFYTTHARAMAGSLAIALVAAGEPSLDQSIIGHILTHNRPHRCSALYGDLRTGSVLRNTSRREERTSSIHGCQRAPLHHSDGCKRSFVLPILYALVRLRICVGLWETKSAGPCLGRPYRQLIGQPECMCRRCSSAL